MLPPHKHCHRHQAALYYTLEKLSTHTYTLVQCISVFHKMYWGTSQPDSHSLGPTAATAYDGTKGNLFLLVDIMKPMVIAVTTRVVVTGCSFTTCSTTPRVLLQASPHLLLQTCERRLRHECAKTVLN